MGEITKNQHYVPRLLLKNFSKSEGNVFRVEIYDSKREQVRTNTSISNVFSQNYFYDSDNLIEKFLSDNVEAPASSVIERILDNPYSPYDPKSLDMLRFIAVQANRTPGALSDALECIDKFSTTMIEQLGKLNSFDPEVTSKIKLVMNDSRSILARQTVEGALNWPFIQDLEWHIFINKNQQDFIISDHPVVHYNWLLKDSSDCKYTSLTSCGLQIFMPLSPEVTYCLYDKKVYEIGPKDKHYTVLSSRSDADILNHLQVRNRDSVVAYSDVDSHEYVQKLCHKFPAKSLHETHSWYSEAVPMGGDKLKSTHAIWRTQASLSNWLSAVKVKNKLRKKGIACYDRCPDIVERHRLFMNTLRDKAKHSNQAH